MNMRSRNLSRIALIVLWLLGLLVAGCGQPTTTVAPSNVPASPTASNVPSSVPAPPTPSSVPSSVAVLPTASSSYWPTNGWRTSPPETQGMDPDKLELLLQDIQQTRLKLHSLLIIRNGYIVSETYFSSYTAQTPHVQYSVTKSVMATLIGIAIDQRSIDGIDQPVTGFFPDHSFEHPDPRKDAMTLEDVLTMRTGLDWQEQDSTFRTMYQTRDWVQFMLDIPMHEQSGQQFRYCSGCSHLLSAIIQARTGMNTRDFAQQVLFDPLGISTVAWERDREGIPIGGWGLELTPRDMAKLGYLYLHNGMWDGQQIVPADWIKAAVQRHTATDGPLGYGYQWWTYPAWDAYIALGRYGQTIFVIPAHQLVIVTTAEIDEHEPIFDLIEEYIVPAAQTTPPRPN